MKVDLQGCAHVPGSVVALGMFDGLHIGHRTLLMKAKVLAKRRNVPLVVSTFEDHPMKVIAPDRCPPKLMVLEERIRAMEELGVDILSALPFDESVRDMPPEDYVGHLVRRFHPAAVVCGYNHTFGAKGSGTPALLTALGSALGFETVVVPKITLEGDEVSSTVIRDLIRQGRMARAYQMLGHPYVNHFERNGSIFRFVAENKVTPPPGKYWVVVNEHLMPLWLRKDGTAHISGYEGANELTVQYLTRSKTEESHEG